MFKSKLRPDGIVNKCKARLIARDFNQKQGIDFEEIFAPVVKWTTVQIVVAIAAQNNWSIIHMDVKTAFFHGDLKEEVYISQPEGFIDVEKENLVYKLRKALYGVRQAPCTWYDKIDSWL